MRNPIISLGTTLSLLIASTLSTLSSQETISPQTRRKPVRICPTQIDDEILVVNRDCGSIGTVSLSDNRVIAETTIGKTLTDMAPGLNDNEYLVIDHDANQLIFVEHKKSQFQRRSEISLPHAPIRLAVNRERAQVAISSLWARQVTVVGLKGKLRRLFQAKLPFAPKSICWFQKYLIIADAFEDRLAIVDCDRQKLVCVHRLGLHNIDGLIMTPDSRWLVMACQKLSRVARADRNDIHWGMLMSNQIVALAPKQLLHPELDLGAVLKTIEIGDTNHGKADPTDVAFLKDGRIAVSIGGTGEIGISTKPFEIGKSVKWEYRKVGQRPLDLHLVEASNRIAVVNSLDDSVSLVPIDKAPTTSIQLSSRTATLVEKGERLFFDGSLSHDRWMSCHSCHPDGHSNGRLNDNMSDGTFGTPKRVLSLLGLKGTEPFAWNGSKETLHRQIKDSIRLTMRRGKESTDEEIRAIEAFVLSLPRPPSATAAATAEQQIAAKAGQGLFTELGCATCHAPDAFTTAKTYDVGLQDERGQDRFNPPSLRGLDQQSKFFHDGRATSLRQVFVKYQHQLQRKLSASELDNLETYLRTL